jgi:hypothetical protein
LRYQIPESLPNLSGGSRLKPWQHQSWIFIRDPHFAVKAARVLDLYARVYQGIALGEDEYVLSSDEKTSIQARCRCHPTLAPGAARTMRVNHEYNRGGALAYLAAYDVHQARVFSHCSPKTGIVPFMTLAEQVMTQEPYASTPAPTPAAKPPKDKHSTGSCPGHPTQTRPEAATMTPAGSSSPAHHRSSNSDRSRTGRYHRPGHRHARPRDHRIFTAK